MAEAYPPVSIDRCDFSSGYKFFGVLSESLEAFLEFFPIATPSMNGAKMDVLNNARINIVD